MVGRNSGIVLVFMVLVFRQQLRFGPGMNLGTSRCTLRRHGMTRTRPESNHMPIAFAVMCGYESKLANDFISRRKQLVRLTFVRKMDVLPFDNMKVYSLLQHPTLQIQFLSTDQPSFLIAMPPFLILAIFLLQFLSCIIPLRYNLIVFMCQLLIIMRSSSI
jgi:hypothetical protein